MPGTTVTFTAGATGGTAPYSYKYWLFNGSTWTMVRDWSSNASWAWTPVFLGTNYRVAVWVRDATTTADVGTYNTSMAYVVAYPSDGAEEP